MTIDINTRPLPTTRVAGFKQPPCQADPCHAAAEWLVRGDGQALAVCDGHLRLAINTLGHREPSGATP